MPHRRVIVALLVALALLSPAAAHARPASNLPPKGKVFSGVAMGYELGDFVRRTGSTPSVWEHFVAFGQSPAWAIRLAEGRRTRLMLALSTARAQNERERISPVE